MLIGMESVSTFEANTHLSALLSRVENGETIVITRLGKPIARLVPEQKGTPVQSLSQTIADLLEFRSAHPMSAPELQNHGGRGAEILKSPVVNASVTLS